MGTLHHYELTYAVHLRPSSHELISSLEHSLKCLAFKTCTWQSVYYLISSKNLFFTSIYIHATRSCLELHSSANLCHCWGAKMRNSTTVQTVPMQYDQVQSNSTSFQVQRNRQKLFKFHCKWKIHGWAFRLSCMAAKYAAKSSTLEITSPLKHNEHLAHLNDAPCCRKL